QRRKHDGEAVVRQRLILQAARLELDNLSARRARASERQGYDRARERPRRDATCALPHTQIPLPKILTHKRFLKNHSQKYWSPAPMRWRGSKLWRQPRLAACASENPTPFQVSPGISRISGHP